MRTVKTSNFKKAKIDFPNHIYISIARVDPHNFEPDRCMKELAPSGELLIWYKVNNQRSNIDRKGLWKEYTRRFKNEMVSNPKSSKAIYEIANRVMRGEDIVILCHCDHIFQDTRCHRHIIAKAINNLIKRKEEK